MPVAVLDVHIGQVLLALLVVLLLLLRQRAQLLVQHRHPPIDLLVDVLRLACRLLLQPLALCHHVLVVLLHSVLEVLRPRGELHAQLRSSVGNL